MKAIGKFFLAYDSANLKYHTGTYHIQGRVPTFCDFATLLLLAFILQEQRNFNVMSIGNNFNIYSVERVVLSQLSYNVRSTWLGLRSFKKFALGLERRIILLL